MKQALVTLNFVVIAVLVTIVAMQHRVDAGSKPAVVGAPIPELLESEIPVERKFSFTVTASQSLQGASLSPSFSHPSNSVFFFEMQLPANVAILVDRVKSFRLIGASPSSTFLAAAV